MTSQDASKTAIDALPPLSTMVRALDMRARKSLGQNFLFDLNLTRRIARSAGTLNGTTIEVGPGPGGLTRALLLEGAKQVIAIEKDFRARSVLDSLLIAADGRLQLVEGDALKTPIWEMGDAPRRIIANLPYNIATSLLIRWLEHAPAFESLTLMFQREVAERITAAPGDSAYGRLSILTGWHADAQILFDIPPEAFVPAPKIISSVVQIRPLSAPRFACSQSALETVTRLAFGQRRKMLRASLKSVGGAPMLEVAGIDPQSRPQDLDIAAFCRLANSVGV
ncbi:MAG: 16S rRNA (adenine(1518)-N(6)/adenine(1519)-N(6))-dimethyltransferase [Rhodospirillaceae bacterium]|nr:16S rRNA (adenine(1518)-N(6)/adenine(1519)-N(6))-dimethyltransferase [Rhodospirillaceae bacterium]